jgi:hypothetical protein
MLVAVKCSRNIYGIVAWGLVCSFLGTNRVTAADTGVLPSAATLSRSPYLQCATPTSMVVVWRTLGSSTPQLRFGTNFLALESNVVADGIVRRASLGANEEAAKPRWVSLRTPANLNLPKLHSAPVGTFQYEAHLTGLQPETRYYYAVYDEERRLTPQDPSYSFVTPPPRGQRQRIRFAVIGDSGTARSPQFEVFQSLLDHVSKTGPALDFWIHVGDIAYNAGRDTEFQTRVFEPYDRLNRNTVCWPTMGNHEGGTSKGTTGIGPYFDAYVLPTRGEAGGVASGTEAYYSFDHGNIHFICLDSHDLDRRPSGAMARWLKADLDMAKADWLIAFWHHPPYSKGSHDSDKEKDLTEMREYIMPIMEAGGVDLVLNGHSHIYERSMLMDGAYATPTVAENVILDDGDGDPAGDGPYRKSPGLLPHQGTLEIVAGNGGQNLGRTGSSPVIRKVFVEHGCVVIDLEGDKLTATMINRNGTVRDRVSLVKEMRVENRRLAVPWQPPAYTKPERDPNGPPAPPVHYQVLVPPKSEWQYRSSDHSPGQLWNRLDYDAAGWQVASAGFGFGGGRYTTSLEHLEGHSPALYLRHTFQIAQSDAVTELGLMVDYSDGFIAYVNGYEVARVNIGRSSGSHVQNVKARADRGVAFIALKDAHRYLHNGVNVLAIEAHANPEAVDFGIDPTLISEE